MKNFLFVVPRFAPVGKYYSFPIGMGYVMSSMKQKGFRVFCVNLCHTSDSVEKTLAESIKDNEIDVLCTGAMSFNWNEVNDVVETTKRIKPGIVTVVGGAIITADPTFSFENLGIDYGVIGEGEKTMAELAAALSSGENISEVDGLIFYDKDKNIVLTKPREAISDLDALPFPDYEGLEFDKWVANSWMEQCYQALIFDCDEKQRLCEIITSRGCPYSCTFCYHPLGKKYRQRSLDNAFKEIDFLVKTYDINILNVLDELFSLNEERVYSFIERIKKYNIRWSAQWRVNNVNEAIFKELKESGILQIGLGVESMSDKILKSMKKKINTSQIESAFKTAHEVGVCVGANIILGDLEETEETVKESVDWWLAHPQYEISLGFILAVPDAPIYRYALVNNLIKDKLQFIKERFPLINLTKMTDKQFRRVVKDVNYMNSSQKNRLEGKVLSSKVSSVGDNGKKIYDFQVKCPLCQKTSDYRYFQFSLKPYSIIGCKHCYKRIKVSTKKIFYQDYNSFRGFVLQIMTVVYFTFLKRFSFFRRIRNMLR